MEKFFRLTDQQENVWNSEMFYSGSNINTIGGYLFIKDKVDFSLLEKATNIYVMNNEVIRYHFDLKDGKPIQRLTEYTPFKLDLISVDSIDELNNVTTEVVSKPLKIFNSNLFKFILFRLNDGRGRSYNCFSPFNCRCLEFKLIYFWNNRYLLKAFKY